MIENPKIILITGCSSGFGLRIAARLAAAGHHVIATMRDLSKQEDLCSEVAFRGGKLDLFALDVLDVQSIQTVIQQIKKLYGTIDVLVNNAGYGIAGFFEDLTQEEIRAQMETNFFGVQNVTREVIPLMREKKHGMIINISSISGLYALPCFGAYCASKWALEGFSESLLFELSPFGVKVCLVEPGVYKTKIFTENRKYAKNFFNMDSPYYCISQNLQKRTNDNLRLERKDPEDIAILVKHLIAMPNPPFRNIPDHRSRWIYRLRRFLPFGLYQGVVHFVFRSLIGKNL